METIDPDVVIEEQRPNYVRYRSLSTGRRWEVLGHCIYRGRGHGPCMDGAVNPDIGPSEHRLDVPVSPELECSLCVDGGHLRFRELP